MDGSKRWEDMNVDCLVNIFVKLSLEDLTLGVPFVCKSWFRASLDPQCWKILNFRDMNFMPWSQFTNKFMSQYSIQQFSFSSFLKLAILRSKSLAIELMFPLVYGASLEDLVYASDHCPKVKVVVLPNLLSGDEQQILQLVRKWKELEQLEMESKPCSFVELVSQINHNCKNFSGLRMFGSIKKEDVCAIVKFLPKLKYLCLSKSYLPKEQLLVILNGCKELQRLTVNDCIGFEADEEMKRSALWIKVFEHKECKLLDDFDYDTDECDPLYVHAI